MGILKTKIKKYDKYIVEIENEEIKAGNFENIEDVIIIGKEDFESELQKSKEVKAKLQSRDLELKLKDLKLQEKDLEIQKTKSKMEELDETYKSELKRLEKRYANEEDELKQLLENKGTKIEELKKEYCKIEKELENETKSLQSKLKEEEDLRNQIEVYRIGNIGLKNEIKNKEEEIDSLKSKHEKEIKMLQSRVNELKGVQIELDKLKNNYRHLQEVANKKDRIIIELEAKKRKLEQYLSMSLEAINTLKNLGLFNRLFKRIPEGIDELREDIKKIQPPKEVEIEPSRAKSTADILGKI